ncbi:MULTISPECIES: hypothetical protein [Clostridium]|uniref:Uncharacterized protein n=3 Tax=Clostridium intestinale TaxID=36845 RepID=U2N0Y1_9CLOT|nr:MULTISPECIES: hypothetical protein [Clostridium]ERK29162.1 hypothetical protein CINTURNW_3654 [Clostridium intestinale URNW]QLY80424.1 hypothetical protein HZF06_02235 [Clostridium intestinale]WRY51083.1 hypothetical protein P8F83_20940 [Clostridium intestinale]SHI11262.1 hypothetical protein SAMN02745941_01987 [Clostridium intestinale DSM 6191]
MKVYIVLSMDTNDVISVDKVFRDKEIAEKYADIQNSRNRALDYFIRERALMENIDEPVSV